MTPSPSAGADLGAAVLAACRAAVLAQREVARAGAARRDAALHAVADAVEDRREELLAANAVDLGRAGFVGLPGAQLDRLRLDAGRVAALAARARAAATAPDPVDTALDTAVAAALDATPGAVLPGARRARVPVGVVGVVHEGSPDDALDAAVQGVRAGCAVVLRGATAARQTGLALVDAVAAGLVAGGLPAAAVQTLDAWGREGVGHLVRARGLVDLVVPLGGAALVRRTTADAAVPVLEPPTRPPHEPARATLDATADPATALAVCAGAWSVLVHADLERSLLPRLLGSLARERDVRGDERAAAAAPPGVAVEAGAEGGAEGGGPPEQEPLAASTGPSSDPSTAVAVEVVQDLDAALDHLRAHPGTGVEVVVTADGAAGRRFVLSAAASVVLVNTAHVDPGARPALVAADLTAVRWVVGAGPLPG